MKTIRWYELAVHFFLYTGSCLSIWIYDFDSPQVHIQPPKSRACGIKHRIQEQWSRTWKAHVKIASTRDIKAILKQGATSLVCIGFHRSLIGGIASRPTLPQQDEAMNFSRAMQNQPYPLHVCLPLVPILDSAVLTESFPPDIPFGKRHNLYQCLKKCLRNKQDL